MAQFALSRYDHPELQPDGGIETGARCRGVFDAGEMEPAQVVVEVLGGDPAPAAKEGLDPLISNSHFFGSRLKAWASLAWLCVGLRRAEVLRVIVLWGR